MIGKLDEDQIADVLRSEVLGRIGCIVDGRPYVVPIMYVYDAENDDVYAHTTDGMKTRAMRANAKVCFEVEQVRDMANWRSVIAFGEYEELGADRTEYAMELLTRRLTAPPPRVAPHDRHETAHRSAGIARTVLFRVHFTEKTGRYEIG